VTLSKAEEKRSNDVLMGVTGQPITKSVAHDHHQVSTATNIKRTRPYHGVMDRLATV
jgi:hypothetical protein